MHLIEPRRELLFEFDRDAFENFLRGSLQGRLDLLRAVRDHLIGLARHLLLLRAEQVVEVLARFAQRILHRFLQLGLRFFGAMPLVLQPGAERLDGGGCSGDGFVQRGTQNLRSRGGVLLRLNRRGARGFT